MDNPQTALAVYEQPRTMLIPLETTSNSAMALAKLAAASGLCKTQKPADAFFVIMYGYELGIPAMTALRTIHIINNTPVCSGEAMLALIRRSGKVEIKIEGTATAATVYMRRKDTNEEYTARWDINRATIAGLTGKQTWKNFPQAFLQWRGVSECGKFLCSDIIGGLYTFEEIAPDAPVDENGEPVEGQTITITAPKWHEDYRNLNELSERAFTSAYIKNRNGAGIQEILTILAPKTWDDFATGKDCWIAIKAIADERAAAQSTSTTEEADSTSQQPDKPAEPVIDEPGAVALVNGDVKASGSPFDHSAPQVNPDTGVVETPRTGSAFKRGLNNYQQQQEQQQTQAVNDDIDAALTRAMELSE